MKRYRVSQMHLPSTIASSLAMEILEEWPEASKKSFGEMKAVATEYVKQRFGEAGLQEKIDNYTLIKVPNSVTSFHNEYYLQALSSFVISSYYPAVTGICSLGERMLNILTFSLLSEYTGLPSKKRLFGKSSCDDWELMINVLHIEMKVLIDEVAEKFRELGKIRHYVIHYNADMSESVLKAKTVEAFNLMYEIIELQFGIGFRNQPWFISGFQGVAFIKQSCENDPFIKLVYLPNCEYVGPYHVVKSLSPGQWLLEDDHVYDTKKHLTDSEFLTEYQSFNGI